MNLENQQVIDVDYQEVETGAVEQDTEQAAETREAEREVLVGVVMTRCPVLSFNPYSGVIVYERDGQLFQSNDLPYDGSGYVFVE